jgi:hypothetical protein
MTGRNSVVEKFCWTATAEDIFLEKLANSGSVVAACRKVGCSRSLAYWHRDQDEAFASRWESAVKVAVARFEHIAIVRATKGWEEVEETEGHGPDGAFSKTVRKHKVSNELLMRVLAAHDRRYRNVDHGEAPPVTVNILNVVQDANEAARKRAAAIRAGSSAPAIEHQPSSDTGGER